MGELSLSCAVFSEGDSLGVPLLECGSKGHRAIGKLGVGRGKLRKDVMHKIKSRNLRPKKCLHTLHDLSCPYLIKLFTGLEERAHTHTHIYIQTQHCFLLRVLNYFLFAHARISDNSQAK